MSSFAGGTILGSLESGSESHREGGALEIHNARDSSLRLETSEGGEGDGDNAETSNQLLPMDEEDNELATHWQHPTEEGGQEMHAGSVHGTTRSEDEEDAETLRLKPKQSDDRVNNKHHHQQQSQSQQQLQTQDTLQSQTATGLISGLTPGAQPTHEELVNHPPYPPQGSFAPTSLTNLDTSSAGGASANLNTINNPTVNNNNNNSLLDDGAGSKRRKRRGWRWDKRWAERLERLKAFKAEFGHTNVPTLWERDRSLAQWVGVQRKQYKDGEIPEDRFRLLNELGFQWVTPWSRTEKRKKSIGGAEDSSSSSVVSGSTSSTSTSTYEHGTGTGSPPTSSDSSLPSTVTAIQIAVAAPSTTSSTTNNPSLSSSTSSSLSTPSPSSSSSSSSDAAAAAAYSAVRRRTRESDGRTEKWMEKFERLKKFKDEMGHTRVPASWPRDKSLAYWVFSQRKLHRSNQISKDRKRLLDELGFEWDVKPGPLGKKAAKDRKWSVGYDILKGFKEEFGHVNVPTDYREDVNFYAWVSAQKAHYQEGKLEGHKANLLRELGLFDSMMMVGSGSGSGSGRMMRRTNDDDDDSGGSDDMDEVDDDDNMEDDSFMHDSSDEGGGGGGGGGGGSSEDSDSSSDDEDNSKIRSSQHHHSSSWMAMPPTTTTTTITTTNTSSSSQEEGGGGGISSVTGMGLSSSPTTTTTTSSSSSSPSSIRKRKRDRRGTIAGGAAAAGGGGEHATDIKKKTRTSWGNASNNNSTHNNNNSNSSKWRSVRRNPSSKKVPTTHVSPLKGSLSSSMRSNNNSDNTTIQISSFWDCLAPQHSDLLLLRRSSKSSFTISRLRECGDGLYCLVTEQDPTPISTLSSSSSTTTTTSSSATTITSSSSLTTHDNGNTSKLATAQQPLPVIEEGRDHHHHQHHMIMNTSHHSNDQLLIQTPAPPPPPPQQQQQQQQPLSLYPPLPPQLTQDAHHHHHHQGLALPSSPQFPPLQHGIDALDAGDGNAFYSGFGEGGGVGGSSSGTNTNTNTNTNNNNSTGGVGVGHTAFGIGAPSLSSPGIVGTPTSQAQ